MEKLSNMALEYASKYPEGDRTTVSLIYAMGGMMVADAIEELLNSQQNLISQVAWDRIQKGFKELRG